MKYFLTILALSFTLCAFANDEDLVNPACGDENIDVSGRGDNQERRRDAADPVVDPSATGA